MTKKRIDTSLHYIQFIMARIALVMVIGFLIYSIWIQRTSAIIFCCLFLVYVIFLLKRVLDRPTEIEYDENFIYLEDGRKRIDLDNVIGVKRKRIFYELDGIESNAKLPNFHFMDKKWHELKELIKNKKH